MIKQPIHTADHPFLYIWCICPVSNKKYLKRVHAVMLEETLDDLLFFGFKDEAGWYSISEFTSGLSAGFGNTAKEAYDTFLENLKSKSSDRWHNAVRNGIKKFGSPANILPHAEKKITIDFLRRL